MRWITLVGIAGIVSISAVVPSARAGIQYPWCAQYARRPRAAAAEIAPSRPSRNVARRSAAWAASASRICSTRARPAMRRGADADASGTRGFLARVDMFYFLNDRIQFAQPFQIGGLRLQRYRVSGVDIGVVGAPVCARSPIGFGPRQIADRQRQPSQQLDVPANRPDRLPKGRGRSPPGLCRNPAYR